MRRILFPLVVMFIVMFIVISFIIAGVFAAPADPKGSVKMDLLYWNPDLEIVGNIVAKIDENDLLSMTVSIYNGEPNEILTVSVTAEKGLPAIFVDFPEVLTLSEAGSGSIEITLSLDIPPDYEPNVPGTMEVGAIVWNSDRSIQYTTNFMYDVPRKR